MFRYKVEDLISSVFFWLLIFVVFLQFFSRFVVGSPVGWTDEVSRYLLVVTIFFGSVIVVRKRENIALDYFQGYLGKEGKARFSKVVEILCICFYMILAVIIFKVGQTTFTMMGAVDFQKKYLYYAVSCAVAMMAIRGLLTLICERSRPNGGVR